MSKLKESRQTSLDLLEDLGQSINENAVTKGFYELDAADRLVVSDDLVGMKLALIHSEVTEILEAIRKEQGTAAIADEFADVLIRLLDLWHVIKSTQTYGSLPDLGDAVWKKMRKNEERPRKHGNKF